MFVVFLIVCVIGCSFFFYCKDTHNLRVAQDIIPIQRRGFPISHPLSRAASGGYYFTPNVEYDMPFSSSVDMQY